MLEFDLQLRRAAWELNASARLEGGCVGLLGRSGSGKSSLLEMIAGIVRPSAGTLALDGRTLSDTASGVFVPAHERHVGLVFQEHLLFPHLSVEGNLRYAGRFGRWKRERPGFDHIVDLLQLRPHLARDPETLSGGEKRRVALGRALLASPKLLLLDEPLTGLDEPLKADILALLQRVRDELRTPMVYVSHDLGEVLRLTNQLWLIDGGRIVGAGAYANLTQDATVLPHLLPLGLVNVLPMEIAEHERAAGCTRFVAPEGDAGVGERLELRGPLVDAPAGRRVALSIRPEDIALASAPVDLISVRNQIRGTVSRYVDHDGRSLIEIDAGMPLLVEISTGSRHRLGLRPGVSTCCLIKATALQVLGARGSAAD